MKKYLSLLSVCILVASSLTIPVYASKDNKEVEQVKNEMIVTRLQIEEFEKSIKDIEMELEQEKKRQEAIKERVDAILRSMQQRGSNFWLDVLFGSESISDFFHRAYALQTILEFESQMFEEYKTSIKEIEKLETAIQYKKEYLESVQKIQNKKIKDVGSSINDLNKDILDNAKDDKQLLNENLKIVMNRWDIEGSKLFKEFFKELINSVNDYPQYIGKEDLKSKGFLTYTLELKEKDFNRFLSDRNKVFDNVSFSMEEDTLFVTGYYQDMSILMIVSYEIVSNKEIQFILDEVWFDGFSLSNDKIKEIQNSYDFGFYIENIMGGIKIDSFDLEKDIIRIQVSYLK